MEFTNNFDLIVGENIILKITDKNIGDDKVIPFYYFDIYYRKNNKQIGKISIRIGSNFHSYYNGHIGYEINPEARGQYFSLEACKLVLPIAKYHGMKFIFLSCDDTNIPSYKVIEKLGAKLQEKTVPPKEYFGYYEGMGIQRIYKLTF